jgi:cephalosporin-C deacetylase-like acetyl esterase
LSIVTASLDKRIKYLASYYPALCDLTGYLHGRTGGWPHLFKDPFTNKPEKIKTSGYYDVVNFARDISVPGIYCFGYNDNVCPPTSIYAAYNQISAPKTILISHDSRHWVYPEFSEKVREWLLGKFEKQ